jgi:hypothetical protein
LSKIVGWISFSLKSINPYFGFIFIISSFKDIQPDKSFQEICKDIIYEDILAEYQDGTNGIVVTDKQLKAMSKKMKKFIKE